MLRAIGPPPEAHREFFEARRNQLVFSVKGAWPVDNLRCFLDDPHPGPRPLASELGGGDLDGDPFGITTCTDIFPREDAEPAEYPPTVLQKLDRPAEWSDVVSWVTTYIGSYVSCLMLSFDLKADSMYRDVLGLLGTRRRLLADQCHKGTKHARSLKLAELYTAAVDAPKSGLLPAIEEIPRRLFKVRPVARLFLGRNNNETRTADARLHATRGP